MPRLPLALALTGWLLAGATAGPSAATVTVDLHAGERRRIDIDDRRRLVLARDDRGHVADGEFVSAAIPLGGAAWRVRWIAQWTAPQRWTKHAGNPVYTPAQTGWSNWVNGVSIVPLADGRTYRMYYAGARGQGIGFAEASVDDPVRWTDHGEPVFLPRADNWEGDRLSQPRVVQVTDTHWRMYYTGWGVKGGGSEWALGLADSFDAGLTWKRHQEEPVLDRGPPGSADDGGAVVPSLLRIGDRWLMWYTGVRATQSQRIHLCLAESQDGVRWEKYDGNPVLTDPDPAGAARSVISRCCVRHDRGVFRLWYSFARPDYRIHYAESLDGRTWEPGPIAPVLGPSAGEGWDSLIVEYPEVQVVGDTFRLWFCGNGFGSVGYATGRPETGVTIEARTGPTAVPDGGWTDWRTVDWDQPLPPAGHAQIRAILSSVDPAQSPTLNGIELETLTPSSPGGTKEQP
jgi:predicted GH43/DUF377 family glycosyl hydrolase